MALFIKNSIFLASLILALLISACQGKISSNESDPTTLQKDTLEVKRLLALSEKSALTNFELSIKEAIQASKIAEKTTNHAITYVAYKAVAQAALSIGSFEVLEIYLQKFFDLAQNDQDEKMIGRAYVNFAMFNLYTNEIKIADSLFTKGLKLIEHSAKIKHEKVPEEDQIVIFLNLGHIYFENKKFEKAESMYLNGFNLALNKKTFLPYQGKLAQSLAIFYLNQKQLNAAKKYLDLGIKIQRESKNAAMVPISLLAFGEYYELKGQINQALSAYEEGLNLATKVKTINLIIDFSDHLYRFHESHGNVKKALYYLNLNLKQKELSTKDKAQKSFMSKMITHNILNEENDKDKGGRTTRNIFLILSFLIVLNSFIFFHKKSFLDKDKIDQLSQEIVDIHKVKDELEIAKQKFALSSLEAFQKEKSLNQIVEKIKNNQSGTSEDLRELNKLGIDLEKINKKKNWDEFEKRFIGIHANFFTNLLLTYPDLTSNERRLCAFLKIDLSTKEIAKLTGQTIRAIELSRIRLRKKLKLTNSDVGLFQYLSNL